MDWEEDEGLAPFYMRSLISSEVSANGKDVTQHNYQSIVETGNDHTDFGALMETGERVISAISLRALRAAGFRLLHNLLN